MLLPLRALLLLLLLTGLCGVAGRLRVQPSADCLVSCRVVVGMHLVS